MNLLLPLYLFLIIMALFFLGSTIVLVREKTYATTLLFGSKFNRVLSPGLHFKLPFPFETLDFRVTTAIQELPLEVSSLTLDKAKIKLAVRVQVVPNSDKYYEAAYMLDNPLSQIASYIENTVRSQVTRMNVEDVFSATDQFENEVKSVLETKFSEYGYDIVNVLIDQPTLSEEMTNAYEAKLVAMRRQEAATAEGEAERIRLVAKANAEGESLKVKASAFKEFRKIIAEGNSIAIKEFLKDMSDKSLVARDVLEFFAGVDERDALRDAAQYGGKVVYIAGQQKDDGNIRNIMAAIEAGQ